MGAPSEYEDDQSSAVVISGGQQGWCMPFCLHMSYARTGLVWQILHLPSFFLSFFLSSADFMTPSPCAASVQMVLRDQTTPGRSRREICELPGNCTVQDLYTKVATEKGYPPTSFELTASDISVELSEENKDVTLDSLGQVSHDACLRVWSAIPSTETCYAEAWYMCTENSALSDARD